MPEEIKSTAVTTSIDVTTKIGWAQLLTKLADKYGLPTVALGACLTILIWHGNRLITSFQEEGQKLQLKLEEERKEDKIYYRGEFKTIVDNSTKVAQEATAAVVQATLQSKAVEQTVEKNTEALEENTEELRDFRMRKTGASSVGSN